MGDMSREPSMEDILSSIRRVIARDEAPGTVKAPRPDPAVGANPGDILDLRKEALAPEAETEGEEELISNESAAATRQSLEALSAAMAAPAPAGGNSSGARSIEDVVVDALRPMLKEWLDANLPQMVETMVAREIARITGRQD
ncbi:DUF2497 domain-containing protein [Sphingopyxis sp. MWB1]|uniref:DUF2497 domain-containing protein n=1 Tax=Sphingopyxis sp. MWB1 TaxID=1537715 RepID=UPI00051A7CD5|nr:DUF2497 domain-containing protein [Sphingopyxis sp. MWB1]